jgi:hypothetical protein
MESIINFFKKKTKIKPNDIGIYRDTVLVDTINDANKTIKYEFFAKVKAVTVFSNLVEIEILDIAMSNSCSQDVSNIIWDNIPRFIEPKLIQWEIKEPQQQQQQQQ